MCIRDRLHSERESQGMVLYDGQKLAYLDIRPLSCRDQLSHWYIGAVSRCLGKLNNHMFPRLFLLSSCTHNIRKSYISWLRNIVFDALYVNFLQWFYWQLISLLDYFQIRKCNDGQQLVLYIPIILSDRSQMSKWMCREILSCWLPILVKMILFWSRYTSIWRLKIHQTPNVVRSEFIFHLDHWYCSIFNENDPTLWSY